MTTENPACKHCTVPTDSADVCTFCRTYVAPSALSPLMTDLANVPHPAGATKVHDWDDVEHGCPSRYFEAARRQVDHTTDMTVHIDGTQWADGNVERTIFVSPGNHGSFDCFLPAVARALGLALIAAADEVEASE